MLGVALAVTGGLTLWLMLSGASGLGRSWVQLLRSLVGWGLIVIPIGLIALGVWLVLRHFGDRLPRLTAGQVVGAGMLFCCC